MPRPRNDRVAIGFMAVWLVVWTSAIVVVLWTAGRAMLVGDAGWSPFLLIWLGAASLGLYAGIRRMQRLLRLRPDPGPTPSAGRHAWRDDLPPRR